MVWKFRFSLFRPFGFIEPCLPAEARRPPAGPDWVFEIKHDGYRLLVHKRDDAVRIFSRAGADWTKRFPRIVNAVRKLGARSLLLDGEGVVHDAIGMPDFALLQSRKSDEEVSFVAFDLLELNGVKI